jgi:type VI secretion system protein ImpK
MSPNDPFAAFESDSTIIRPTPGARGGRAYSGGSTGMGTQGADEAALHTVFSYGGSPNPLVAACAPLLGLAPRLRAMSACADPLALRDALARGIRQFEQQARSNGVSAEHCIAARYMLCTMLDEAASCTPWGAGVWASHSLLVMFHNENWGGEKAFQLLARLAEQPARHLPVLELMNLVLALGFEGRYQVLANGKQSLDAIRAKLYQLIRAQRGEPERELSPHWQGVPLARRRTTDVLPVWICAAFAALLAAALYAGFAFSLDRASDPVFDAIASTRAGAAAPTVLRPAPTPRLAELLAPEIRDGLVAVSDQVDRSVVTLRGDSSFAGGSADVSARMQPVLQRIAQALNQVPGNVLVTGHTDDQPIRSMRYPSNWELSRERADNVRALLAATVDPKRLNAEGKGDADPLVPNDSPAARARNRRVEITLFVKPGGERP